jgi:D-alanyl-D-alanine carboxypeptidase/D-alanyl-D-alanine-endopeptidase (penicillin-binding protein 4)
MSKENTIDVKGKISLSSPLKLFQVSLENPHLYAGHLFKDLLQKYGVVVKGKISVKKTPNKAFEIGSHSSRSVRFLSDAVLKNSDNLYSECFFKKIGQEKEGSSGTWQYAQKVMREFLAKTGIDVSEMVIKDGSGLTRYNLASPHQFVTYLSWMQKQSYFPAFLSSLAVAGVDGTLKNRMQDMPAKVRAKTGGMTGINSICGFVMQEEEMLAFAILFEGNAKFPSEDLEGIEDEILSYLADLKR